MKLTRKTLWPAGAAALLLMGVVSYAVLTVRPSLRPITDKELEPYAALAKIIQASKSVPSPPIDDTSVGYPKRETELSGLNEALYVFQVRFRRLPNSLDELPQIIDNGPGTERARKELQNASGRCKILTFGRNSYALNCDGWNPDQSELAKAYSEFNKSVIKYYLIGGHVVLYSPPLL
jgi:hypothetical protein